MSRPFAWTLGALALISADARGASPVELEPLDLRVVADVVLYAGDAATAKTALSAAFPDRAASEFTLLTAKEWLADKPITLTAGSLAVCTGPAAPPTVFADALKSAAAPLDELDFAAARPFLDAAHAATLCVDGPFDAPNAAKVAYLRGVVAYVGGDSAATKAAYREALTFDPTLAWDPAYPPSAKAAFEDAKTSSTSGRTALAIVPRNVAVRVDGREVTATNGQLDLADGTHLVQLGADHPTTVQITAVGLGAASLLVPPVVPADAAAWASDPALGPDLARLIAVYAPETTVYAVSGPSVYLATPVGFTRVVPPDPGGGAPIGPILLGTGGGVFTAGAALAVVGFTGGRAAIAAGETAGSTDAWAAERDRYAKSRGTLAVGRWVAVGGLAIAGAGAALLATERPLVMPVLLADGGGLVVAWRGGR